MNLYKREVLANFQKYISKELDKVSKIKIKDEETWVEWSTKMDTLYNIYVYLVSLEDDGEDSPATKKYV